jgi:hypothetical protein
MGECTLGSATSKRIKLEPLWSQPDMRRALVARPCNGACLRGCVAANVVHFLRTGVDLGCWFSAKPLPVIRDDHHKPLAPALREGALARGLLRRVTAPGTGPNRTESLTHRLDSDSGLSVLFDIVAENRTQ